MQSCADGGGLPLAPVSRVHRGKAEAQLNCGHPGEHEATGRTPQQPTRRLPAYRQLRRQQFLSDRTSDERTLGIQKVLWKDGICVSQSHPLSTIRCFSE